MSHESRRGAAALHSARRQRCGHAPAPDVDRLISGGRVRRRRRNAARLGVAAAAAVLVGGGAYGVTQLDPSRAPSRVAGTPTPASEPATIPPPCRRTGPRSSPGTYRMLVGVDAAGGAIDADLTFDGPDWIGGTIRRVRRCARPSAGSVSTGPMRWPPAPVAPATSRPGPGRDPAGPRPAARRLPRSTVVQPPTPVQAFGHDAVHLRLRIDDDAPRTSVPRRGDAQVAVVGITLRATAPQGVVIDFWVVDLDGTPVVVDSGTRATRRPSWWTGRPGPRLDHLRDRASSPRSDGASQELSGRGCGACGEAVAAVGIPG